MTVALGPVLGFAVRDCLLLHIEVCVRSAAFQWLNVVNHVSPACAGSAASRGTGMLPLEAIPS